MAAVLLAFVYFVVLALQCHRHDTDEGDVEALPENK